MTSSSTHGSLLPIGRRGLEVVLFRIPFSFFSLNKSIIFDFQQKPSSKMKFFIRAMKISPKMLQFQRINSNKKKTHQCMLEFFMLSSIISKNKKKMDKTSEKVYLFHTTWLLHTFICLVPYGYVS
jgi:hypothetical protein